MADLFGRISWPGLRDFDSCNYTCAHGTAPGIATLVIAEEHAAGIEPVGDLKFTDGVREVRLPNCRIVSAQFNPPTGSGRKITIQIADGRWSWAYGGINGRFNIRDDEGRIIKETHKPPSELLKLLLDELGAREREIIPPDPKEQLDWPEVDWDRANPAAAMEEIAQHLGAAVCYQPCKNKVLIAVLGKGAALPDIDPISKSAAIDFPQTPKQIRVVGGEVVATVALCLEAVAIEPGGAIVALNDVSYKPANGWGRSFPPYFQNLTVSSAIPNLGDVHWWLAGLKAAPLDRREYEELARRCVFKWYRIFMAGPDGKKQPFIPLWNFDQFKGQEFRFDFTNIEQVLPQQGIWRIGEATDDEVLVDGAKVYGVAHQGAINAWANTARDQLHDVSFSIDSEKGLVKFDRYMYRINPTAAAVAPVIGGGLVSGSVQSYQIAPAELVLVASCFFREKLNGPILRYFYDHKTGSKIESPPAIYRRPNIREIVEVEYDPSTWKPIKSKTNKDECDAEAKFYAKQVAESFTVKDGGEITYPGIQRIDPDGYVRQVTWTVGGGGICSTHVSYNTEASPWIASYKERRKQQKLKTFIDYLALPIAGNWMQRMTEAARKT